MSAAAVSSTRSFTESETVYMSKFPDCPLNEFLQKYSKEIAKGMANAPLCTDSNVIAEELNKRVSAYQR
jgi:hypothetical protein